MNNNFPGFNLWSDEVGRFAAPYDKMQLWLHNLPVWFRSPLWPGTLATLTALGLLLALYQVVSGAVQQGASRNKAAALHSEAMRSCNTLSGPANLACLRRLEQTQLKRETSEKVGI